MKYDFVYSWTVLYQDNEHLLNPNLDSTLHLYSVIKIVLSLGYRFC